VLVEARRSFCAVCRSPSSSQLMRLSATSQLSPVSTSTHGNVVKINLVTVGKMKLRPIKYVLNRLFFLITEYAPTTASAAVLTASQSSQLDCRRSSACRACMLNTRWSRYRSWRRRGVCRRARCGRELAGIIVRAGHGAEGGDVLPLAQSVQAAAPLSSVNVPA